VAEAGLAALVSAPLYQRILRKGKKKKKNGLISNEEEQQHLITLGYETKALLFQ
jgi:hypothetical protein